MCARYAPHSGQRQALSPYISLAQHTGAIDQTAVSLHVWPGNGNIRSAARARREGGNLVVQVADDGGRHTLVVQVRSDGAA